MHRTFLLSLLFIVCLGGCSPENFRVPSSVTASKLQAIDSLQLNEQQQEGYAYSFCSAMRSAWSHFDVVDITTEATVINNLVDCNRHRQQSRWRGFLNKQQDRLTIHSTSQSISLKTIKTDFFKHFCTKILDGEEYRSLLDKTTQAIFSLEQEGAILSLTVLYFSGEGNVRKKDQYQLNIDRDNRAYGLIVSSSSEYPCSNSNDYQLQEYRLSF